MLLGILASMFLFPAGSPRRRAGAKVALCALMLFVAWTSGTPQHLPLAAAGGSSRARAVFRARGTLLAGLRRVRSAGYSPATAAAISSAWLVTRSRRDADGTPSASGRTVRALANIFRELIASSRAPHREYIHPYAAIAPAGACAMDTALPFIKRAAGEEVAVVSIVTGVILSSLVPVFVTLFAGLA